MNFGMWDTLYNVLLLLFWTRLWVRDDRDMATNRYLSGFARLQKMATNFLAPVLPFLGPRLVALVALVFLVIFRGVAVPNDAEWTLRFGFVLQQVTGNNIPACMLFSVLSFALFLFNLWGLSLIYVRTHQPSTYQAGTDALYQLSRPFTDRDLPLRPLILLVYGTLIAYAMTRLGGAAQDGLSTGMSHGLRLLLFAVSGWIYLLPLLQNVLFLVIIGSWVSGFAGSSTLGTFCREWIDMLIGPVRRYPIRIGMMDLTPLVFMFALGLLHVLLRDALIFASQKLL